MALFDNIRNWLTPTKDDIEAEVASGENTTTEAYKFGYATEWFFNPLYGQPRKVNITQIRNFANSIWIRMCVDTITEEVTSIPYQIKVKEGIDPTPQHQKQIEEVTSFLDNPNRNKETYSHIMKQVMRDILEIDAGVIIKVFDKKGELIELYARDGGTFLKNVDRFGIEKGYYQYSFKVPNNKPIEFNPREVSYFMAHPRTSSFYGWSPIQSLLEILETLNNTIRYNKEFFNQNAIPNGILEVLIKDKDKFKRFREGWENEVKGQFHKMPIINFESKWTPFNMSNKDMEFLDSQSWYMKLVMAMFKIPPSELGFTDNVNYATASSQERVGIRKTIKPYLDLLEYKTNAEIMPEFGYEDLEFCFDEPDYAGEQVKRQQEKTDLELGVRTINEVRAERGLEPVEWGDTPYKGQPDLNSYIDEEVLSGLPAKSKKQNIKKKVKKNDDIDAGQDMIEEADGYMDFLDKFYNKIEREIISDIKKQNFYQINKGYTDFLKNLFSAITTLNLKEILKRVVKKEYTNGIDDAEDELKVDIGYAEKDNILLDKLTEEQVNGYTLPNGEKWFGIKGATEELRYTIMGEVQKGIEEKKSNKEIASNIQEVFDVNKSRATTIARTETNRIVNLGKINSYTNSGLGGFQVYKAHIDSRTSPICKRLNGQKVPAGALFKDPKTGKEYRGPPAHPNCRSTIIWKPK